MNTLIKSVVVMLAITFFSNAIAFGATTGDPNRNTESVMVFQVIQNQLIIDSSTIESATILSPTNSSDPYGLQLKLKNTAANELARISGENIGKQMNMVLDGIVISSATIQTKVGAEFQMSGLTKQQAEQFVKGLGSPK